MKRHNPSIGIELLLLLKQRRRLYHHFRIVIDRQHQPAEINSLELLLKVIPGWRKLFEKLRELNDKLRPMKANRQMLSGRIWSEYKAQIRKIVNRAQEIIRQILTVTIPETTPALPPYRDWKCNTFFIKT